jgi:hypothetical protein
MRSYAKGLGFVEPFVNFITLRDNLPSLFPPKLRFLFPVILRRRVLRAIIYIYTDIFISDGVMPIVEKNIKFSSRI